MEKGRKPKLVRAENNGNWLPISTVAIAKSEYGGNDCKGYYSLLGVSPSASFDEIRRSSRDMMRRLHPDAGGSHEEFCKVAEASRVLLDPRERERYDRQTGELAVASPEKKVGGDFPFTPIFWKECYIIVLDGFCRAWVDKVMQSLIAHRLERTIRIGFRQGTDLRMEGDVLEIGIALEPEQVTDTLIALIYMMKEGNRK